MVKYSPTKRTASAKLGGFFKTKLMPFLKSNWFMILCLILVLPYLYRYVVKQIELNKEQSTQLEKDASFVANSNPMTQEQRANKITANKELHAVAKKLAHDLGTKYSDKNSMFSWIDPRGWTENDDEVTLTLIKYRTYYPILQRLYYSCYSNSRDLSADLLELLDSSNLKRLRASIKI
jgi:hypothetical protein